MFQGFTVIKSKLQLPVQDYASLEEMIDQAKLIEEDFINSADEDPGFHLVKMHSNLIQPLQQLSGGNPRRANGQQGKSGNN